jgi:glycine betaine/choline ABC-type transport system substrate-binding protein
MRRAPSHFLYFLYFLNLLCFLYFPAACHRPPQSKITIGSKFFTEQVILAELLAQHIEARTGIPVIRKTNLGGTLLVHKALQAGELDLYVEYTGTALTAVLNESPSGDSVAVYNRVKQLYAQRFNLEVTEPLGFANTFAMVVRGGDAKNFHLHTISDIAPLAPKWRVGVGYEFIERPDGFRGWSERYALHFAGRPRVMDLGLIYRALVEHQVDIVANSVLQGVSSGGAFASLFRRWRLQPPRSSANRIGLQPLKKPLCFGGRSGTCPDLVGISDIKAFFVTRLQFTLTYEGPLRA